MMAWRVGSRPVVSATMLRVSAVGVEVVAIQLTYASATFSCLQQGSASVEGCLDM